MGPQEQSQNPEQGMTFDTAPVSDAGTPLPRPAAPTITPKRSVPKQATPSSPEMIFDTTPASSAGVPSAVEAVSGNSDDTGPLAGVIRGAKSIAAMPGHLWDAVTQGPQNEEEEWVHEMGVGGPQGHIPGPLALPIHRLIIAPMEEARARGEKYEQMAATEQNPKLRKQLLDAAGTYKGAAFVPLVGPLAAQLSERAAYGPQGASVRGANSDAQTGGIHDLLSGYTNSNSDLSGATSEALTDIAIPEITEGAVGKAVGGLKKLRPTTETVGTTEIPVRSSVANLTTAQSVAERLAPTPELQKFDIENTHPAVRAAINDIATGMRNEVLDNIRKTRLAEHDTMASELDGLPSAEAIDQHYRELMSMPPEDFQGVADSLRKEFSDRYKAADKISMKPGEKVSEFQKAQDAEKAARANFDSEGVAKAIDEQRRWFNLANDGSYDTVRKSYRLDDIQKIHDKFNKLSVVKNTPSQFLSEGEVDPGIIDGRALKQAVRELYKDGTLGEVMGDQTERQAANLQKLGDILERSKAAAIKKPLLPYGTGPLGPGLGATTLSAILHAGSAASGGIGAVVGTGAYGVRSLLGHLLTNPEALANTLAVLEKANLAASKAAVPAIATTHKYDPDAGKVVPLSTQ